MSAESGQDFPSALEESATIPGLYETWVELEERVKRAQNELQAILATREEAAILRGRAQKQLDEGEAIRAEAQRVSESAWRAFDRGFAVSAKGLPNRWTTVREIDEAMRTYTALQRATHSESWQEADRTRQRATTELLKALAVLNTAMAQAQRELKEAANLPSVADALMQSAQEELRCAQAIRSELLLLGQEALNELDAAPFARQPGAQEITISDPQDFPAGILTDAGLLGAAPLESAESQGVPPAGSTAEPGATASTLSDAISGQASVAWESPRTAEPMATPESETSDPETPEEATLGLGGAFDPPEPEVLQPAIQPDTVDQSYPEVPEAAPPSEWFTAVPGDAEPSIAPQLSPEVPEAAPPSEWFTEQETPAAPEVPTIEAPTIEAPAAQPATAEVPTPVPPPVQVQSEAQALEEEIAAATPASASPGSAAAAMAEELARSMGSFGVSAGSGEPPDTTPTEVTQPTAPEAAAPPPEPQGRVIEMPAPPHPNAAEQLRSEMEAATPPPPMPEPESRPIVQDPSDFSQPATPVIDMPEPRQQPTAAELLRQEMQSAAPPPRPEIVEPPVVQAPEPAVSPPVIPPPAAQTPPQAEPIAVSPTPTEAPTSPAPVGTAPAATYTGRIYLMFPSSLSQGRLESVWDLLDQVAGSGNITDTRLISREAGIQFTLDLGDRELDIEALRRQFSDAEIVAIDEDRLQIVWSGE